jgi:hypothetical protein
VWEKFVNACMSEDTKKLMEEIASINLAYNHKPFNATSSMHKKFLQTNLDKVKQLQEQYSYLDFSKELKFFAE